MPTYSKSQQTDFNFDYGFNQPKPLKKPAKRKEFKQDPLDRICKDVRSQVQAITQKVKEQYDMALPKPTEREYDNNDRDPKLEPKHVKGGAVIVLTGEGIQTSSDFGDSLCLYVTLGKKKFAWFVNMSNKAYKQLYKRFGSNIAKWKGKVKVTKDTYLKNDYIKIVEE